MAGHGRQFDDQRPDRDPRRARGSDCWEAQGCEGWGWQAMLPYFCKLETDKNFPDAPITAIAARSRSIARRCRIGETSTARCANPHLASAMAGTTTTTRLTGTGVPPYAINSEAGRRVSTNDGYLEPARGRDNLFGLPSCLGRSTEFEGTGCTPASKARIDGKLAWIGMARVFLRRLYSFAGHFAALRYRPTPLLELNAFQFLTDLPVGETRSDLIRSWMRCCICASTARSAR